jgi:SNF2 family DNA or RNA helicase
MWSVGLGKTAATITAIRRLLQRCEIINVLIVGPRMVVEDAWPTELANWAPDLSFELINGDRKSRMRKAMQPCAISLISRDNIADLIQMFGNKFPFDMVVLDESHSVKSPSSKRFKSIRKIRHIPSRWVLLSATPASESLEGLWAQFFCGDGGERLGRTFTAFRDRFFEADYLGWNWTLRKGSEVQIRKRIEYVTHTLKAEDYLSLPERIDNVINVTLSASERRQYEQLELDYLLPVKNGEPITAANAAVLFGKLAQLSGGCVYSEDRSPMTLHTRKIDALDELVEVANGTPVLVFYGYRHERDRILGSIKGAADLDVAKWNAGRQRVAIAHAASAGAGLNLQHGGNVMCWYSLPPSLELYTQACGRLHRQGQKQAVVIHHLVASQTIDEDILALLQSKKAGQDRLLDALKRRAA